MLDLHAAAGEKGDAHLCDFLEANYLDEQVTNRFSDGNMEVYSNRFSDGNMEDYFPPFQENMTDRQAD